MDKLAEGLGTVEGGAVSFLNLVVTNTKLWRDWLVGL